VPEDNVEIYKQLIRSFNERGIDGAVPFFSDDAEVYDPDLPGGTYRGRDGVRHVIELIIEGADVKVRDFELHPAGDRVVALVRTHQRSRANGAEIELHDAHMLTFRDGKIVYWRVYLDPAEALADAGLTGE